MSTDALSRAIKSTRPVLSAVRPDQLDDPTPCQSWTVRGLINHMIAAPRWASSRVTGDDESPAGDEDFTAGDFLAEYDESARRVQEVFKAPGVLEKTITLPFAEVPGAFLLSMVTTDQFQHGWDLARAIGVSTDLDPELARQLHAQVQSSIPNEFRGEDGKAPFGPVREASPGAPAADQLAAFLGRAP